MKPLFFLLPLIFSFSSHAETSAPSVTCFMEHLKTPEVGLSAVQETVTASDDDVAMSDGLDFRSKDYEGEWRDYNYSFVLEWYRSESSQDEIVATFQENNHVQDEVGQIGCLVPKEMTSEKFCEETITTTDYETDTEISMFSFYCKAN